MSAVNHIERNRKGIESDNRACCWSPICFSFSRSRIEDPGGGGGGTQQSFIQRGSAPGPTPLPLVLTIFDRRVPLSYTVYLQMVLLSHT